MPISNLVYYGMRNTENWPMPRVGRYRKVGEIVVLDGKKYRVDMVNPCRARCRPLKKNRVTIHDKVFNKTRTFMANGHYVNISPIIC